MTKKAYVIKQRIEHNGIDYNPFAFPFEQQVIFADPYEVLAALGVGAIEEDSNISVPPDQLEITVTTPTPKTLTPLLKPIS